MRNVSYYHGKYISVAEKKAKAIKSYEKLKKKDPEITPIIIKGRKLARTWWGKAWNDNLESYSDYSNRLPRGRGYVRHRAVLDLKIEPGKIKAQVHGSRAKPYQVDIKIKQLGNEKWEKITEFCQGKLDSLQELISGKFPESLTDIFTDKKKGLFPAPREIEFECSCPDYATMCKHIAATLYGVGSRLDENTQLLFLLRNVNIEDLINRTINEKSENLLKNAVNKSSRVIEEDDISTMFGVDMDTDN